eukprot:TRINITY_DN48196_c0_g1_i1.p1 TRINITY_DN48196_c0_g1~~TRINITY_DN48196_c0_g1_i1.p1  ORF type:complete len:366 (+),score=53.79 TRINITY_DN48196_c0_g1_i1:166-1263(+)
MPSTGVKRFVPQSEEPIPPEEHHAWTLKMWNRMDRNNNGFVSSQELDCEEFRRVIRSILAPTKGAAMGGASYARAELNMKQAIHYCLRKADLNNDNQLSFDEFKSFLATLRRADLSKHTAYLIFALFDLDGDKMVDESEFREVYKFFLGHNPTEEEFQEEWGRLDVHGQGAVNVNQYITWLKANENPIFSQHAPAAEEEDALPTQASTISSGFFPSKGNLPRLTRSASSSFGVRAKWNQRFNAGANKNDKCPQGQRNYFMKPQSLPELDRYYQTHRGFWTHLDELRKPMEKPHRGVLSTDRSGEIALPRSRPTREGDQRHPITKERLHWEEHWQNGRAIKEWYQPGTLTFRCPGPPPPWMLDDGE